MWSHDLNAEFTLTYCFLGNVRITKNADPNKYPYSGYEIRFDSLSLIPLPNDWCKNAIILELI